MIMLILILKLHNFDTLGPDDKQHWRLSTMPNIGIVLNINYLQSCVVQCLTFTIYYLLFTIYYLLFTELCSVPATVYSATTPGAGINVQSLMPITVICKDGYSVGGTPFVMGVCNGTTPKLSDCVSK